METYQQLTDHLKTIEKHEIHNSSSQSYITFIHEFMNSLDKFCNVHPKSVTEHFYNTLLENNISWDIEDMSNADVTSLDEKVILALILGATKDVSFYEGALLPYIENGSLERWLKRLKYFDSLSATH